MSFPTIDELMLLAPWIWIGAAALALSLIPGSRGWRLVVSWVGVAGLAGAMFSLHERDLGPLPRNFPPDLQALSSHWVMYAVLGAGVLGVLESLLLWKTDGPWKRLRWLPRLLAMGWFLWGITSSLREHTWDSQQTWIWLAVLGVSMVLLTLTTESASERLGGGPMLPLTLGAMAGLSALIFQNWESPGQAELCGLLAVSLTLGAFPTFFFKQAALPPAVLTLATISLSAIWVEGLFFLATDLPQSLPLLVGAAPLALLLCSYQPLSRLSRGKALAVQGLLVLALLGYAFHTASSARPDQGTQSQQEQALESLYRPR